jgi:hypothetical protein
MLIQDTHVHAVIAERHSEARAAQLRSRVIAARKHRRRAQDSARWIRRVLVVVR